MPDETPANEYDHVATKGNQERIIEALGSISASLDERITIVTAEAVHAMVTGEDDDGDGQQEGEGGGE